jgi:hypothetical protein
MKAQQAARRKRQELYEIAKDRNIPGRSKMGGTGRAGDCR